MQYIITYIEISFFFSLHLQRTDGLIRFHKAGTEKEMEHMGTMRMQFVLFLALLEAVLSIPHSHTMRAANALAHEFDAEWDAPAPVPTSGCMAHINQTECSADKCCNW